MGGEGRYFGLRDGCIWHPASSSCSLVSNFRVCCVYWAVYELGKRITVTFPVLSIGPDERYLGTYWQKPCVLTFNLMFRFLVVYQG